jgi:hypothetical protein
MGKVKSALAAHLSSTDRGASTVQDAMARNEVSLLLSLYAGAVAPTKSAAEKFKLCMPSRRQEGSGE